MTNGEAFLVGATGQIGRAAVRALTEDGWRVRAASRGGDRDPDWPPEVEAVAVDREDDAALAAALGDGCDVLLDCAAFGARHARQWLDLADRIGSAVVISSAAVYQDDHGRGFDTQDEPDGFPVYPVPIPETQRTVPPGDGGYGAGKVALERELLAVGDLLPTTLLRAGAVHGPHDRRPRELHFVKRALDRRPVRLLGHRGESRFHPVHVSNVAELVRLAVRRPGSRVLNAGDPDAPTVAEIAVAVDAVLGTTSELVRVPGELSPRHLGWTPWSVPRPMVLDMTAAARELGYRPVTGYVASLPGTAEWLARRLAESGDWRRAFPALVTVYEERLGGDLFDYAGEDAWLRAHRGSDR